MCGIVAYVGRKIAQPLLIEGLKRLEYRGYDSAGIAVIDGKGSCTSAGPSGASAFWKTA
jgi:glucosamine--fructose-6-phosphate aminotransferase (isomerizing)